MKKFWILFVLIFPSCDSQKQEIEFALEEAGENRNEVEAILQHYEKEENDPLKLKAAQYLIRYMPYHFSYGEEIKDYYHAVDSVIALSDDKLEQEKHIKALRLSFEDRYKLYRDIKVIRADFLIKSIDEAFTQWRHGKWATHLTFDEFCEYLLPYKCFEGQPLDNWRSSYYDLCKGDIDMEWNLTNGSVALQDDAEYQYWRFKSSDTSRCDMAELFFYNSQDSIIRADIIDCGRIFPDNEWKALNISDGDQQTNFSAKGEDYWVGFDFGEPVNLSKISYIRRCDGNSVQPGLEYSFYYWDNSQWRLIETKTANDVFVEFENVPRKALLAIKCSQGEEQRIFICDENNKISWY